MQMTVRSLEGMIDRMIAQKRTMTQRIQGVYRDHRLFVNAMLNTVRTLQTSGIGVTSRVTERTDGVEITVLIPRMPQASAPGVSVPLRPLRRL